MQNKHYVEPAINEPCLRDVLTIQTPRLDGLVRFALQSEPALERPQEIHEIQKIRLAPLLVKACHIDLWLQWLLHQQTQPGLLAPHIG